MDARTKQALAEGLVDALGFVSGALAGALLGRSLGFDFLADGAGTLDLVVGVLLVGLGAGGARHLARRMLLKPPEPPR